MRTFINLKLIKCRQCGEEISEGEYAHQHDEYEDDVICESCYREYIKETI
jgi:formylmethanofuran dehydrogenase subunit E